MNTLFFVFKEVFNIEDGDGHTKQCTFTFNVERREYGQTRWWTRGTLGTRRLVLMFQAMCIALSKGSSIFFFKFIFVLKYVV